MVVPVGCPLACLLSVKAAILPCTTRTTPCTTPRWQEECPTACHQDTGCRQVTEVQARTAAVAVDTGAGPLGGAGVGADLPDVELLLDIPLDGV